MEVGKVMEKELRNREQSPLITIIVPVYQVRAYVGACVESLLRQTYTNLEIILVDDGSTDGSGAVCDEYARRDSRIRVIHQENGGLSAARNKGLDAAKGEYIAFVDSDDAVLPAFIEILYKLLVKYHADIAGCAYVKRGMEESGHVASEHTISDNCRREVCMSSEKMLRQWHGKYKKWETVAWNKLYRKRIWNGDRGAGAMRFPIGRRHEDVLTSHLAVHSAKRVALTTQALYLYRTRPESITAGIAAAANRQENLRAQRERMAFFRKRRYWRAYLNLLVGYVLHLLWFACRHPK